MFKNPSTKRFKTLRKHLKKFERRVILTGTPAPNSLMDLWSQIFILDLGERLDTAFFRFKNRFFRQVDYMGFKFEPLDGAAEKITELISDIIFRVEDDKGVPPETNLITVTLPADARKMYNEMERHAFIELAKQETISAANAAAAMMKLRQVASGFVYDDDKKTVPVHREKINALRSVLDETGSPVIVVYQFQHELAALRKAFPEGVTLDDGWTQKSWDAGKHQLLFLHPASGGHGLNLQYGSHTMVVFSASFSYEQMAQTRARIDRQGQKLPVMYHFLRAADTVDDLLLQVLERKHTTQANVLQMVKEYADARTN
jgi:SNF2 family DNA or RNA helicase